jgi:hypothetical protein
MKKVEKRKRDRKRNAPYGNAVGTIADDIGKIRDTAIADIFGHS